MSKNKNKILTIVIMAAVAIVLVYLGAKLRNQSYGQSGNVQTGLQGRPLPQLSTAQQRINSYTPVNGDIKYRIVQKSVIGIDLATNWNLYTSKEYGFSFIFPPATKILDNTEALGYQLPPNLSYKGARDSFQIVMQGKNNADFLLLMDDLNFGLASTTVTASSTVTVNGIKMLKEIWDSSDTQFKSSEIISYSFEQAKHGFIWYGTFDSKDFESINDFESIVASMKFQ